MRRCDGGSLSESPSPGLQNRLQDVGADPFPLPPVVRIYNAGGPTFDLRSGISADGEPTFDDLRTFALAALPPAEELASLRILRDNVDMD